MLPIATCFFFASTSWVLLSNASGGAVLSPWQGTMTYSFSDDFCTKILERMPPSATCRQVVDVVADVMQAWSDQVTNARFQETSSHPELLIRIGDITPRSSQHTPLASVHLGSNNTLTLSSSECWYLRQQVCGGSQDGKHRSLVAMLCLLTGLAVGTTSVVITKCEWRRILLPIAAFAVSVTVLQAAYAFLSCFPCHSLQLTLFHEIGHIMGLGHVDELGNQNWCSNCSGTRTICSQRPSLMQSQIRDSVSDECLLQDDVDGVRWLFDACGDEDDDSGSSRCVAASRSGSLSPLHLCVALAAAVAVFVTILQVLCGIYIGRRRRCTIDGCHELRPTPHALETPRVLEPPRTYRHSSF